MFHFDRSDPSMTRGCRISCLPPRHSLPAFLNLNGMFIMLIFNFKLLIIESFW